MGITGQGFIMRKYTKQIYSILALACIYMLLSVTVSTAYAHDFGGNTTGSDENAETDQDKKTEDQKEDDEIVNDNDNCGQAGGPVSLFDGKELMERTDMVVKGLFPIRIARLYDSRSKYDSQLGYGWSLNHDRRLYEFSDGSVVIRYGCGSRDRFVYTGGAYVTPDQGRQGTLTENPDGSFVYHRRYGTIEYYDSEGRITAVQNKYGHRHEYTYDSAGKYPLTGTSPYAIDPSSPMTIAYQYRITRIDERAADGALTGNYVTFAYSPATGRLIGATASDGRSITYMHDNTGGLTLGNLVQVNGLEGIVSTYQYNDPNDRHNLTYIQNEQNATPWVNTYDSLDRVIQQVYGNDTMVFDYVVDYTETKVTHTVTDAAGINPYDIVTTYQFDTNGDVSLMRDYEGNESVFLRDGLGNLVSRKYYNNQGSLAVPNLVLQREVDFTYDAMGRMLTRSVTLDDGEVIVHSWTWDNDWLASEQVVSSADPAKIFRTEYDFYRDGQGVPTNISEIRNRKSDGSYRVTMLNYDAKNRLEEVILPDGQKLKYAYEGASLFVTKKYFEIAASESPYRRTRYTYDARGYLNSLRDAHDNQYQFTRDDLGRLTSLINPLGEETIYTYNAYRLVQAEYGQTVADGEGRVVRYTYTPQGWISLIEEKDAIDSWHPMASYTYDSAGQELSATDALGHTELSTYDGFGQLIAKIDPLGNQTTYTYDLFGNQISITDPEGRQTLIYYDDIDRETRIDRLGVTPAAIEEYDYDANGNLVSVIDAEGKETTFDYDTLSRLTSVQLPLGQTEQYVYDDRDRLDYVVNARGQKIDYGYEPWGPVSSAAWYATVSAPTPERTITYGLDIQGNIVSLTDDSIQAEPLYTYTYDELNRPDVTTATYIPGGDRTLDEGFDRFGNRNSLILNDGVVFSHSWIYDERNRLVSSSLPGGQSFSFSYFENSRLKQITYPNGVTTTRSWRDNGPSESIDVVGTGGSIVQYQYTYDKVLNTETMSDVDGLHNYTYDGLDRLTNSSHPAPSGLTGESWVYDPVGNREDPGNPDMYIYDDNHRMTQSPSLSYVFDDDGNLISRSDGVSLAYDEAGRLASFNKAGTTATYLYDPFGRRIAKTVNGITTWFLWDDVRVIAEYDESGNRIARYAYNPPALTAAQFEDSNGIYTVHTDSSDLPRFLTDSTQQMIWESRYNVFGSALVDENPDGDGHSVVFAQRYPGQYQDQESGFFYNYSRYYDPTIGRYISADTIGDGHNWYVYARNNPLMYADPFGLASCGILDRLKSAGWAGVAMGYYGLSKSIMEPTLGALDWGINRWGYDSDLAGQWKKEVSDEMVRMGSIFVNRAAGRSDNDSFGENLWGYGEIGVGVINTVRDVRGLHKRMSQRKRYPGRDGREKTIRQRWGYAKNKRYGWRARMKWGMNTLNDARGIFSDAHGVTKNVINYGSKLRARVVNDLAGPGNPQTGQKTGP